MRSLRWFAVSCGWWEPATPEYMTLNAQQLPKYSDMSAGAQETKKEVTRNTSSVGSTVQETDRMSTDKGPYSVEHGSKSWIRLVRYPNRIDVNLPPPDPAMATMGISLSSISFSRTPINLAKGTLIARLLSLRKALSDKHNPSPSRTSASQSISG